jgi:hypothetical protein
MLPLFLPKQRLHAGQNQDRFADLADLDYDSISLLRRKPPAKRTQPALPGSEDASGYSRGLLPVRSVRALRLRQRSSIH